MAVLGPPQSVHASGRIAKKAAPIKMPPRRTSFAIKLQKIDKMLSGRSSDE
jgi:hypothetical protein